MVKFFSTLRCPE